MKELYRYDYAIDRSILREILNLGETVIPDMELVLSDIIEHNLNYAEQEICNWYTLNHALHLLGELQSAKSLPAIFKLLNYFHKIKIFWNSGLLTLCCGELEQVRNNLLQFNRVNSCYVVSY